MTPYRSPDRELWPGLLDGIVDRYVKFAEDHYEIEVALTVVEHVLAHRPRTDVVVQGLESRSNRSRTP